MKIERKKEEKVTGIAIKNRWTGSIIFQSTKTTYKDAVREYIAETKKKGIPANLISANLISANLTGANLTGANLAYANLISANFTGANLTGANLTGANLISANLTDVDLTGANLAYANLTGANLTGANFTGANLTGCLFYFGTDSRNFEALCKAIKTIKHPDGNAEQWIK